MTKSTPPGPAGLPLLGSLFPWLRGQPGFLLETYRRYGEVVRFEFLGFHGALLHGAEANRYILIDAVDNFQVGPVIDRARARWIVGQGILFIDEPEHQQQRRLMLPSMHRKRIGAYQQVMREVTTQILGRWQPGVVIDVASEMDDLALIIEGRTLFSLDLSGTEQAFRDAVTVVTQTMNDAFRIALAQFPFDIPGIGYGRSVRKAIALIRATLEEIIARHEREGSDAGDIVSMLVTARDEEGHRLSPGQIMDHLLTLFVAGHETLANALSWACYLLAQHPRVTSKLLGELEAQLAGQPPTPGDLERLPYLEQVVKEVLRLYPPAASLSRIAREPFEWKGYAFHAGDIIMYSPYVSHRMPAQFSEPEVFRPERFDPLHGEKHPPGAYLPFGAGPRTCLGAPFAMMELKTVLAMLVQRFRLDVIPDQRVEATVRTTLQPKYGLRMRPHLQDGHVERSPARVLGNVVDALPHLPEGEL
ncbi:MAG TPA: cytochrome P450 [Ktedonobacteraceae bacterium]|nr:cytochrome P450 [Ktedonobacteraceae bacterium]